MQSSRFSTYASKSSIKNGRVVTSQTGRWSGTSCSWTTGCLSLCSNTILLIESIYTKLLTHPRAVVFHRPSVTGRDTQRTARIPMGTAAGIAGYGGITSGNPGGDSACTEVTSVYSAELGFVSTAETTKDRCVCEWHRYV